MTIGANMDSVGTIMSIWTCDLTQLYCCSTQCLVSSDLWRLVSYDVAGQSCHILSDTNSLLLLLMRPNISPSLPGTHLRARALGFQRNLHQVLLFPFQAVTHSPTAISRLNALIFNSQLVPATDFILKPACFRDIFIGLSLLHSGISTHCTTSRKPTSMSVKHIWMRVHYCSKKLLILNFLIRNS